MKMFGSRSLAVWLFWISRTLALGLGLLLVGITISFTHHLVSNPDSNEFFFIIPLISTAVSGVASWLALFSIVITLTYYVLFFFLMSRIWSTFKKTKLFTYEAISSLKLFTFLNLVAPPLFILIELLHTSKIDLEPIVLGLLHIIIGLFVWFIYAIFKKGNVLQNEAEFTI